jgi:N-acetylmuramoyl-L-alanine amidase
VISLISKNAKSIVIAITAVFLILNLKIQQTYAFTGQYNIKEKKIILIDPGHGGIDGGAESKSGTIEKNINLSISLKLKKILEKNNFKVIMTREEDKGLYTENGTIRKKKHEDLENRCKIKQESHCDMFVSIHLNMFPQSKYYGAQVWYSNSEESKKLAHIIQENLKEDLQGNNKRIEKPAKGQY